MLPTVQPPFSRYGARRANLVLVQLMMAVATIPESIIKNKQQKNKTTQTFVMVQSIKVFFFVAEILKDRAKE